MSAFFFPVRLHAYARPGGRPQRFAVVVYRQPGDVGRDGAAVGLLLHEDGDGTAFHAGPEADAAAAGKRSQQGFGAHRIAFKDCSNHSLVAPPSRCAAGQPLDATTHETGTATYASKAS